MTQVADGETQAFSALASDPERAQLDFYELPRPIQDRFLASASGTGAPKVLLFEPASAVSGAGWIVVFVISASVVSGLAVTGYGNLQNPMALQSLVLTPAYGAFGGLAAIALAAYGWSRSAPSRFPYRLGTYLFPAGLLVASGAKLRWFWIQSLEAVEPDGTKGIKLRFSQGTFDFRMPEGVTFDQAQQSVQDAKLRYQNAAEQRDRRALAALDPLRDSGFSNPLSGQAAIARPRDQRIWRYMLAALIGGAVAVTIYFARNKLGEQVLYRNARELDTTQGYQDYVARGGDREDVRTLLMPRAVLNGIRDSLADVEKFSASYTDTQIRPEIDEALRQGLRAELAKAREVGTLQALIDFQNAHPDHALIEAEIALARQAVFQNALQRYQQSTKAPPSVQKLFFAMIRHSEKAGPLVEVRFRRNEPRNASVTDSAIRRSAYYAGVKSLPSQYFLDDQVLPREADAAKQLVAALQQPFSGEILQFVHGPGLTGDGELPKVDKPTLFVTHVITMSGGFTTNRPRNVYVGLGLKMSADFVVPEFAEPYEMSFSAWLPPDVSEISRERLRPEDVYDKNARLGFTRFNEKLLAELLPSE